MEHHSLSPNKPDAFRLRRRIRYLIVAAMLLTGAVASETFAFPVAPTTLSYSASTESPTPPAQTVTFSKNSLVARPWTASGNAAWVTVSPSSGTIAKEKDQITVQANASGLAVGTYSSSIKISIEEKNGRTQVTQVPVTLIVSGGVSGGTPTSGTTTSTPSLQLNPTSLNFSGTAGGTAPLAQTVNLTNPTGGTLTWTLTESASWLGLNVVSGTTTTEADAISASVGTTGLAAGTYSTAIVVTASGASNSPQTIPVTLTLNPPTTTGTASLSWDPNTEENVAGYNVYMGTQPGVYGTPISVGVTTSYTAGGLTGGKTYYFSVTAFDSDGNESMHSTEVSKPIL